MKKMKAFILATFIILTINSSAQDPIDSVFIKYNISNDQTIRYKTDTLLFESESSRNILSGTAILPSTTNQFNAYWTYGLLFEKVESIACPQYMDPIENVGMEDPLAVWEIKNATYKDSLYTVSLKLSENCCYSFLCDIKVENDSILNLIYYSYGARHCDCICVFGLNYTIKRKDFLLSDKIKFIMFNGDNMTLTRINEP